MVNLADKAMDILANKAMDILGNQFAGLWDWDTATNLKEKMNDLKRKREVLNALKENKLEELKRSEEQHPRKKRKKEVELWISDIERKMGEIQDLEQKIGESNFLFRGFQKCKVVRKIQEVDELFQQGKSLDSLVVDNPEWIEHALSDTTLIGEAAKSCMENIWAYLMDDNIHRIGVWGVGGIGKTSIMKLVHDNLVNEAPKFGIVRWITVSKEMNIIKLQDKIACAFGVTLVGNDEILRAGMIRGTLTSKGKYVLILDDLWDQLSLEQVGIPKSSNGSKILVTTQLLAVCHFLGCREVKVPTLSNQDAWSLFLEKVGQDVLNHLDLLPIVKSVAKECAALPLAIVSIASSMREVLDIHEWRNAFHELERHVKCVNGMDEMVFQQLQFNYDRLGDEKLKHCFLCCALYPEDHKIYANELIELWIAEGLVEEMGDRQKEIDRGHNILNKLKSSCLIKDVEYENQVYQVLPQVKLHDVVRDMSIRITSVRPRFLVRSGMQLTEITGAQDWDEDLEKASFMENQGLQIPSQMPPPKCHKLTTLLLSNCKIKSIPECFFGQMHGLKILNLSHNYYIKSLPNPISNLETLTTLLLGRCCYLEEVPSFSKLQALKKLKLYDTTIKDVPHGMERLVKLEDVNLSHTSIKEMANGILANFTSLHRLALNIAGETHVRGEEIGGLRKLEEFYGRFYDLKEFKSYGEALFAKKRGLRRCNIRMGAYSNGGLETDGINNIELEGCDIISTDNDIKVPSDIRVLFIKKCRVDLCEEGAFFSRFIPAPSGIFSSLFRIDIRECKNIKKLFSSNWLLQYLPNLERLRVAGCEDIEEIVALESELEEEGTSAFKFTLPKLSQFTLKDLPELKRICGANGVMVCNSIQNVCIENCPNLRRTPLNLPLQDDGQPSPPPCISVSSMEWSESLEWDHPNDKSLLEPYVRKVRQNAFGISRLWLDEDLGL